MRYKMVMPAADEALRNITGVREMIHCGTCNRILKEGESFAEKGTLYCKGCRVKVQIHKEYGHGTWSDWWKANKDTFEVKN